MDRLSLFAAMITWTLVSGVLKILFMSRGYIGWGAFGIAVVAGFVLALPLAKLFWQGSIGKTRIGMQNATAAT